MVCVCGGQGILSSPMSSLLCDLLSDPLSRPLSEVHFMHPVVAGMVLAIRYIREGSTNRFKLPCVQDELHSHTSRIFIWLPFTVASAHEIYTQWDVHQASTYIYACFVMPDCNCVVCRHVGLREIFLHCLHQL